MKKIIIFLANFFRQNRSIFRQIIGPNYLAQIHRLGVITPVNQLTRGVTRHLLEFYKFIEEYLIKKIKLKK